MLQEAVTPERIRKLREALGLTQKEMAEELGITRVTIARWETGTAKPKGLYLKALQGLADKARKKTKGLSR